MVERVVMRTKVSLNGVYDNFLTELCIIGHKCAIHIYKDYLVVVSPPFIPSAASNSATVRKFVAKHNAEASSIGSTDISRVGVFDAKHKFVAHSSAFKEGVREVFVVWNRIYVLCNDGRVCLYVLQEPIKTDEISNSYPDSKNYLYLPSWTSFSQKLSTYSLLV